MSKEHKLRLNFAKGLTKVRKKNGLSQEDVANGIGVRPDVYANWEAGKSSPDNRQLIKKLIAFLDTDIYKLLNYK